MSDLENCPVCGYSLEAGHGECKNCGAIFELTRKVEAGSGTHVEKDLDSQVPGIERKLPIWMKVRDLGAIGQQFELDNRTADARELCYQALELAAGHRRENPAMSDIIRELLERMVRVEGAYAPA